MNLRGLLVAASGFLFIFSPGLPIGLLRRRVQEINRNLLYWGIGVWLIAQLPANFFKSLMYQLALGTSATTTGIEEGEGYFISLLGALITAFFIEGGLYLILRRKRQEAPPQFTEGLSIGFGVGLIAQVFIGLSLVGSGMRLLFGDTTIPFLGKLTETPGFNLFLGLSSLVLYRATLLVVTGVQGVLVARAVSGQTRMFWLAMGVDALFMWLITIIQITIGSESPGQLLIGSMDLLGSVVTVMYYVLIFVLAYRWLISQIPPGAQKALSNE